VQNLHCDLAAFGMDGIGYLAMFFCLGLGGKFSGKRLHPTGTVRRVTAGDNQADITPGTLGEVGRKSIVFVTVFEPGVHGAHEDPVL